MLTIRDAQMAVFAQAAQARFEARQCARVAADHPEVCAGLSREVLARAVRDGIARALQHGLETERDIARYLDAVFVLGPEFDTDPACAWANAWLTRGLAPSAAMDAVEWELRQLLAADRARRAREPGAARAEEPPAGAGGARAAAREEEAARDAGDR